ncbi:neutral zinc metallopeptidase [soil metagenome]
MKAGGGLIGLLVLAAAIFLPRLLGSTQGAIGSGASGAVDEQQVPYQCDTEQKQIICGATDDVAEYWIRAYGPSFGGQYQETTTEIFSGSTNTGCGQASSQVGPFYCPADGLVYFDLRFLTQLQEQFNATGDLAAQYIVAHEYGHHVQNLLGTSGEVNRASQQNPGQANTLSIALELQADCFAGAWARDAEDRQQLEPGEITEALEAAAAVGDDRIQQQTQGRVDPESWTHGSSDQRVSWFRRGFDTGDPRQCDTFAEL